MKYLKVYDSFDMRREKCDRCGGPTNNSTTMSIFNTDVICMSCKEEERKDPEYKAASIAEEEAYKSGVKNYSGVMPDYKPIKRN
jgi:hypothetical protein